MNRLDNYRRRYRWLLPYTVFITTVLTWAWLRHLLAGELTPPWVPIPLPTARLVLDATCATIVAALILRLALAPLVRTEQIESVTSALSLDADYVSSLSRGRRRDIVRSVMQSLTDPPTAALVVDELLAPYFVEGQRLRESKRYDVRLTPMQPGIALLASDATAEPVLPPSEFYVLDTHDVFVLPQSGGEDNPHRFRMILCFTHAQLEASFAEADCVFRELALLPRQRLATFTREIKHGGVRKLVAFEFNSDTVHRPIVFECRVKGDLVQPAECSYDDELGLVFEYGGDAQVQRADGGVEFDIALRAPFSRQLSNYPIIYSEPTKVGIVSFDVSSIPNCALTWSQMFTSVDNRLMKVVQRGPGRVSMNFSGRWVFPVSGVVFIWAEEHADDTDSGLSDESRRAL